MRKIRRRLSEQYMESPESAKIPLNDYISKKLPAYDMTILNDLVALRVILREFAGRKIDDMPESEKQYAINSALDVIRKNLEALNIAMGGHYTYDHEFWNKVNGYRCHHFDVKPINGLSATRFEIQLRTEEWHEISEHGKAAHFYYIGGSSEFVDMVKDSYKDRIHMFRRK
jgi:ppGpp synthetase/RelA/SpoT-type nucleotidyltranferase